MTDADDSTARAPHWKDDDDSTAHAPHWKDDDDGNMRVVFDPHVATSRRRRDSMPASDDGSTRAGNAFLHRVLGHWDNLGELTAAPDDEAAYLKTMTRGQLHDMVLGLREMGRKYGACVRGAAAAAAGAG